MKIISLIFHLSDLEFVITRLLRNAEDMGNLFRPLSGEISYFPKEEDYKIKHAWMTKRVYFIVNAHRKNVI
jgi:hypothetical protein